MEARCQLFEFVSLTFGELSRYLPFLPPSSLSCSFPLPPKIYVLINPLRNRGKCANRQKIPEASYSYFSINWPIPYFLGKQSLLQSFKTLTDTRCFNYQKKKKYLPLPSSSLFNTHTHIFPSFKKLSNFLFLLLFFFFSPSLIPTGWKEEGREGDLENFPPPLCARERKRGPPSLLLLLYLATSRAS